MKKKIENIEETADEPIKIEIDVGREIESAKREKRRAELNNFFYGEKGYDSRMHNFSFDTLIDIPEIERMELFEILSKEYKFDVDIKGLSR